MELEGGKMDLKKKPPHFNYFKRVAFFNGRKQEIGKKKPMCFLYYVIKSRYKNKIGSNQPQK